jgi:hypothetical protein
MPPELNPRIRPLEDPMKKTNRQQESPMGAEEYAGFLRLWLTPASRIPAASAEVDAYLRYANEREPLSETSRRALGQPTTQAA